MRQHERSIAAQVMVVLAIGAGGYGWRHDHHPGNYVGLMLGLLLAARAVWIGRPLTIGRYVASLLLLFLGILCAYTGHQTLTAGAQILAGAVVGLPRRAPGPGSDIERIRVQRLVEQTSGDTLAPFALRTDKSYVFSPDRTAVLAYKVRFGTAVASGDPVGNPGAREAALDAFLAETERNGWRATVVGAGETMASAWRRHGYRGLCIGRDVVLDVPTFSLAGRQSRNLRQAVSRAANAGVTTTIVSERALGAAVRAELVEVARGAHAGAGAERGFSMILDHLLDGTHPNTVIAYARDGGGRIVGFQRYAIADAGREFSLDVPYRVPNAPNGVDERLITDVVQLARTRGALHVSLAFAAFPELFANTDRGLGGKLAFRAVHELDRWIRLESLYRFLRKFNAFGKGRYVMLRPSHVLFVLLSALTLEFGTRSAFTADPLGGEAPEAGAAPQPR